MNIPIDIKHRERIIINGDGQRLTRIKGEVDPNFKVATPDVGNGGKQNETAEGEGEKGVKEEV